MEKLNLTMIHAPSKSLNMSIGRVPEKTFTMNLPNSGRPFATYIYDQMAASSSWVIEHNLHCFPSVSIVDTGGNVVIGEIQYISNLKLIVTFSSMFSGKAYLN